MSLGSDLFGKQPEYVRTLAEEEKSLAVMCRAAGRELLNEWKDQVICARTFEQVLAIVSQASFTNSPDEHISVARIILHCIDKKDIPPYVIDAFLNEKFHMLQKHQKTLVAYDLGARCLVSLGMFEKALMRRHSRRGSPDTVFYREVGKRTLAYAGLNSVSAHFQPWEDFMKEYFVN